MPSVETSQTDSEMFPLLILSEQYTRVPHLSENRWMEEPTRSVGVACRICVCVCGGVLSASTLAPSHSSTHSSQNKQISLFIKNSSLHTMNILNADGALRSRCVPPPHRHRVSRVDFFLSVTSLPSYLSPYLFPYCPR